MEYICKYCNKIFASRTSLWNHQHRDPSTSICSYHMEEEKKRGRGRPPANGNKKKKLKKLILENPTTVPPPPRSPTTSDYDVASESDVSVSDVEQDVFRKPNRQYTPVEPKDRKRVKVKERMPEWMFESFEKAKEMISDGASDKHIRTALKYDRCFKRDPNDLRKSFKSWYEKIVEPLIESKEQIEEIKKTMELEKQKELHKILNVEKGKSVAKLEEDKAELEKELLIVNYGLKLRAIHPSMKSIKLMESVIPESKLDDDIGVNVEVSNSQYEPDLVLSSDEKEENEEKEDEKKVGWGIL